MANPKTPADLRFEEYLDAYGYSWEYEPPDQSRPADYVIHRGGATIACEVKSFETQAIRELGERAGGPVIVPPNLLYRTIQKQTRRAASKLKKLANRGWPLVVVLSNPSRASVYLDPATVFHALYGQASPEHPAPKDGLRLITWPRPQYAGRDGVLHAYPETSAVLTLHAHADSGVQIQLPGADGTPEDWDIGGGLGAERPPFVHVMRTVSASAVPLPDDVFDGPLDATWALNAEGAMEQSRGLVRPNSLLDED